MGCAGFSIDVLGGSNTRMHVYIASRCKWCKIAARCEILFPRDGGRGHVLLWWQRLGYDELFMRENRHATGKGQALTRCVRSACELRRGWRAGDRVRPVVTREMVVVEHARSGVTRTPSKHLDDL